MKCQGKFKYKGIVKKDGGEFINNRGEKVKYDASYSIKVDEITETGIYERTFKTPIDSPLVAILATKDLYSDIIIEFDILLYGNIIKLNPINVK